MLQSAALLKISRLRFMGPLLDILVHLHTGNSHFKRKRTRISGRGPINRNWEIMGGAADCNILIDVLGQHFNKNTQAALRFSARNHPKHK